MDLSSNTTDIPLEKGNVAFRLVPYITSYSSRCRGISVKYFFKKTYLVLGPQYRSTSQKLCFMAYAMYLAKPKHISFKSCFRPGLSFLPTLLMISEACSLAPCVYPLIHIKSKF